MAWISARADERDLQALLAEPGLGIANEGGADSVPLRRRVDAYDLDLADPPNGIDDPGGDKPDELTIDLGHRRPCRVRVEDLAHFLCLVIPPVLAMEKLRQLVAEHLVDRGEHRLPDPRRKRDEVLDVVGPCRANGQLHAGMVAERRAS